MHICVWATWGKRGEPAVLRGNVPPILNLISLLCLKMLPRWSPSPTLQQNALLQRLSRQCFSVKNDQWFITMAFFAALQTVLQNVTRDFRRGSNYKEKLFIEINKLIAVAATIKVKTNNAKVYKCFQCKDLCDTKNWFPKEIGKSVYFYGEPCRRMSGHWGYDSAVINRRQGSKARLLGFFLQSLKQRCFFLLDINVLWSAQRRHGKEMSDCSTSAVFSKAKVHSVVHTPNLIYNKVNNLPRLFTKYLNSNVQI